MTGVAVHSRVPLERCAVPPAPAVPTQRARSGPSVAPAPEVVHLAAECWPYARTGGLAESVHTLASAQRAGGQAASVVLPLYGVVADTARDLAPATSPSG